MIAYVATSHIWKKQKNQTLFPKLKNELILFLGNFFIIISIWKLTLGNLQEWQVNMNGQGTCSVFGEWIILDNMICKN
jgi:hypothetical protein